MDSKIEIPFDDLKTQDIQKLMVLLKQQSKNNLTEEFLEQAALPLWNHLEKCLGNLDDQLLCATCFYSVMSLGSIKLQDHYMNELLMIFSPKPDSPSRCIQRSLPSSKRLPFGFEKHADRSPSNSNELQHKRTTLRVISLIYGLFQSSFLTQLEEDNIFKISQLLKEMFGLLLQMGYEYSEYTFLIFKIITMFKKLCGGHLEKHIYNNDHRLKILALVNNNWESPITGVRDLNRSIFQTFMSTLDKEAFEGVAKEVDSFYWNKAKYLMLSDIIDSYNQHIVSVIDCKWIEGLIYSLYKPGLVSAGADMYYTVLKKINNQEDWSQLFLPQVLNILSGSNTKAINNFCNYWCLPTLKKFRTLSNVLIDELQKRNDTDQILYSTLYILKQSYRLGIIDNNWNSTSVSVQNAILAGIDLNNANIRMLAFEILCVSQGKSVATLTEYDLILDYICHNLNSDSTVLRISMLSSLSNFLINLNSTLKYIRIKSGSDGESLENLLSFCRRLQNLIEINIGINGNYQRKITSVKLCNTVLKCFNTISKKKKVDVSLSQENVTFINFLNVHKCWYLSNADFVEKLISLLKDPSDDIRENVIKVLLSYYTNELQSVITFQNIVDNGKIYIQSKFFYEINCGQGMFKLITNILLKKKVHIESDYKSVEDIFEFAFNELTTQHAAKTNVLNSIERGQQLHSYISILLVVLEECIANSYTIASLDRNKMSSLLDILESVSNQFVWEGEASSDFSEMSDMIQNIIITSDYNSLYKDDAKISGLQQIVLNCLWLNVKETCALATTLIQYNVDDVSLCERCLNIITRVLETSRHKGAIEAAGAALGKGIHYLTSSSLKEMNTTDVSKLPYTLLQAKLHELISETNKMSSITRRGAGLSIMLHRIVANDMMKGKPLFHYFIKALLQKCKHPSASSLIKTRPLDQGDTSYENIENQIDLPAAIYIHFLTRIVTDSSLATDIMYYSTELAELAFGNLTSSHWQIRNAALQLYGALVPRLIGQNKASGLGDDTIATVACDEMITHSPKLWKYMTEQLKDTEGEDLLQTHSNLVPVLNMLASCAKRYHFSLPVLPHQNGIRDLFDHLIILLGSPINTVRRMTAKAIFNMYDFEHISDCLLIQENVTENLLHGTLLLLHLCVNYYSTNGKFEKILGQLREKYNEIFVAKPHSYLCKTLYEDIFSADIDMQDLENIIAELKLERNPGKQIWLESHIRKFVNKCSWDVIPNLLNVLLPLCSYGNLDVTLLEFILSKLEDTTATTDVLLQIANTLIASEKMNCNSNIWKMLYEISSKVDLHQCVNEDLVLRNLNGNLYSQRYIVPLTAKYIGYISGGCQSILVRLINDMSDFEISDVDMRYIAAQANNELAHNFDKLPDSLKVISIKCAVFLLQDEDEDIRNLSVNFYCVLVKENRVLQPYICLTKLLEKSLLNSVFIEPQKAVTELKMKINDLLKFNHKVDEYNPFANDSKNMYLEPHVLKNFVDKINL